MEDADKKSYRMNLLEREWVFFPIEKKSEEKSKDGNAPNPGSGIGKKRSDKENKYKKN